MEASDRIALLLGRAVMRSETLEAALVAERRQAADRIAELERLLQVATPAQPAATELD